MSGVRSIRLSLSLPAVSQTLWFSSGSVRLQKTGNYSDLVGKPATNFSSDSFPDKLEYLYHQPDIDVASTRPSVRLTPSTMLYTGRSADGLHMMRSAQYLQKELPVRVAHRIAGFRALPFIIACNPTLMGIQELYVRSFKILSGLPNIKDSDAERAFCRVLKSLLEDHKDVVTLLARGFKDSQRYIVKRKTKHRKVFADFMDHSDVQNFLDRMLTSRLGIRMLAEHHLALHADHDNYVGIIQTDFSLTEITTQWANFCRRLCEHTYGVSPNIELDGHLNITFPYIPLPLNYMLPELLKNALRATVELHRQRYKNNSNSHQLPDVVITLASNESHFMVRISDRGGGIPTEHMDKIFHYNFSTASASSGAQALDAIVESGNQGTGPMHGYGFGLPTCKAYAEYLGGSLTLENMLGIGCDVYLKLRHIDARQDSFRI